MNTSKPIPGTQIPCNSTGGKITFTRTGFIHTGGKNYGNQPVKDDKE